MYIYVYIYIYIHMCVYFYYIYIRLPHSPTARASHGNKTISTPSTVGAQLAAY